MSVSVIAASVFLLLQSATASIEGFVINSTTNKPIAGAQVTAVKLPGPVTAPAGGVVGGVVRSITTVTAGGVVAGGTSVGVPQIAGGGAQPVQIAPATTDANGHFAFSNLEPATYLLRALADGYAQQEYNVRPADQAGMSTQVTLSAGS